MPEDPSTDALSYALSALLLMVVAVGLSVAGVILLVTCEATTIYPAFASPVTACSYPFEGYGAAVLYLGALTAIGSFAMYFRFRALRGLRFPWDYRIPLAFAALGVTILYILVGLILSLF
jgi:hypothetical protein